jgi:phospholipid/cholesterol/gamma-HCH transport system substrate-binding protein
MEADEVKQNVKLGTFVSIGAVLFLVAVIFIGSASNFFTKTFLVSAIFKNIEGLKEGDKVWLSGVQIGTVKSVRIIKEGEVIVSLSLKEKQNEFIRKNATAFIGSDGLVGSKIVVIRPGDSVQVINDADTINARSPADTQELINIAKEVGENTRSITEDLKNISAKVRAGQGIVGELMNDGVLSQEVRRVVQSLKMTGENASKASAELSSLAYELRHGKGLVPRLVSDTSYSRVFSEVLVNVKDLSVNAKEMSESVKRVTTKMNDRNNAIGVLLADTVSAHKLQNTIKNAESASLKLDQNMEALKHNFLLRGYFRKQEKKEKEEKEKKEKEAALAGQQ